MIKVIAIVGPTAVGKSALAVSLAKKIGGEIISCDSMQVYRGMDIATAKVTSAEQDGIPHHLIDICEPSDNFSCADYKKLAEQTIEKIVSRKKTPIFCGGTGLYLDAVLSIDTFEKTQKDTAYRESLERLAKEQGNDTLYALLEKIDGESAKNIHKNNVKRVIRALEIYHCTGKKKSELDKENLATESPYDATVFYLDCHDKEELKKRIENRVDEMMQRGLLNEARSLYEQGFLKEQYTSFATIGYKEFLPYFDGTKSLESCVEQIKIASRQYAKRQRTWFSKKGYLPIFADEAVSPTDAVLRVLEEKYGTI